MKNYEISSAEAAVFHSNYRELSRLLLILILGSVCYVPQMFGQSLQWSQITSQNEFVEKATWVMAVEKEANGAIYTLSLGSQDNTTPTWPTTDTEYYGTFKPGNNQYSYLSKYSADGTTLEWVRVISASANPSAGIGGFRPIEMKLSPTGEIVCLFETVNTPAPANFITADAQYPNPPAYDASLGENNDFVIAKFDTNGDVTYASYLFDPGLGDLNHDITYGQTISSQIMEIGADGAIYFTPRFFRNAGQPTNLPTTAGALATSIDEGSTSATPRATYFTIINADHTIRYATWLNLNESTFTAVDSKIAPNGDFYLLGLNYTTESIIGVDVPANAYVPSVSTSVANQLIRFDANGNLLGSTFLPSILGNPTGSTLAIRPNGNVIAAQGGGQVFELSADLTTLIQTINPFGINVSANGFQTYEDFELDDDGRIHFTAFKGADERPTTPGALSSTTEFVAAYYGILDCNLELVYGTEIQRGNGITSDAGATRIRLFDLEVEGCNAYMGGFVRLSNEFPLTPTAFSNDGTMVLSGYDITPIGRSSGAGSTHRNGVLMAFNYPVIEAGTNVITPPAITNFCSNSVALPIVGTETNYITPQVIGPADDSPAPTPTYYQWQVATSGTGPWTDIEDANVETLVPEAPATPGMYFYRRKVRQTPYGLGFCVPACDVEDISNVVELSFSSNISHSTDIPEGVYGICPGSTSASLTVNITPSADGDQGPYDYRLTTQNDLLNTALGIQGQVASSGDPISFSVSQGGDYILQVTDSRDCVSFDTLVVEDLVLEAGPETVFTCGEATVQLGPISLPPEYVNFPTNTFVWSPADGLDNPNAVSPIFTHGLAVGASTTKTLTFNGCLVDQVEVVNEAVTPLPALPTIELCQGETAQLATNGMDNVSLITAQSGVTYEWAPGLGVVNQNSLNSDITSASAPAGVNNRTYYLLATAGNTGCVETTTQEVIVYRQPNQSFTAGRCLGNACDNSLTLTAGPYGTEPEPGISYSWTATVEDDPMNVGNTGVPSDAEALSWIVDPTSSFLEVNAGTPGNGYAAQYGYTITYVRTSFNTADPSCMRTDTITLGYCCGGGPGCDLALGNAPTVACGGVDNVISPGDVRTDGNYFWSRLDGQPLNNELFDAATGDPLTGDGPHPAEIYADPAGLTAIDYVLSFIYNNPGVGDTCSIDVKVFPAAVATPNVNYPDEQAVCQGTDFTLQGPAGQPGLVYAWEQDPAFLMPTDTAMALPTINVDNNTELFISILDPSTGCTAYDTVALAVTQVNLDAGNDDEFCDQGATIDIGGGATIQGYTYQWSAVPAAGVSFGDATAAQTTATLPATTAGQIITLYLDATNGLTPANCTLRDSIVLTANANPPVDFGAVGQLCPGGEITIGPIFPSGTGITYNWSGPGITSGQGTNTITINAVGQYDVTVTQGSCTSMDNVTVTAPTEPVVDVAPAAPCAMDATIGAVGMALADRAQWTFSWDNYSGLIASESDLHTITVRPTTTTTYTMTATHSSGCIRIYPVVVPAAMYSAELPTTLNFCEGEDTTLPLNDFSAVGGSVMWTVDVPGAEAYLSSPTDNTPTLDLSLAEPGQYNYTATVTYGAGCESVATTRVNVGLPIAGIAGVDQEVCSGECVEIGISRVSGVSYTWTSVPEDASLTASSFPNPTVCPTENTVYTLTYTDAAGCTHTDEVEVRVVESPSLVVQEITGCQNASGTASIDLNDAVVSNNGSTPTFWLDENAIIPTSNLVTASDRYYILCTLNGCETIQEISATIFALPEGAVTPSFTCLDGGQGILNITSSETDVRYDVSMGSSYSGSATYATATVLTGGSAIVAGLPLRSTGEPYTVRFFGADANCFSDVTVTLPSNAACQTYTLGSTVFEDNNNNGLQDSGDSGISMVQVQLFNPGPDNMIGGGDDVEILVGPDGELGTADDAIGGMATSTSGDYFFQSLPPGNYYVQISDTEFGNTEPLQVIHISSTPTSTTDDETDNDDNGSQAGGAGTVTTSPIIELGEDDGEPEGETGQGGTQDMADDIAGDMTVDFGFFAPASLGDTTFVDVNENGLQDIGEPPVQGVTVTLFNADDGTPVTNNVNGNTIAPVQTNANGFYEFTELFPGSYYVVFDLSSVPGSDFYEFTNTSGGDEANDSDADPTTGQTASTGEIDSGERFPDLDAGVVCNVAAEAGTGQTLCSTTTVDLSSLGASFSPTGVTATDGTPFRATWTTSGSGTFNGTDFDGNAMTGDFDSATTYTFSETDIQAGGITLTLTTDDPSMTPFEAINCGPATDEVNIVILRVDCGSFPWDGND